MEGKGGSENRPDSSGTTIPDLGTNGRRNYAICA